jgi:L1 cell adhesion molecule like protein
MKIKTIAHQTLYTEYATINDIYYYQNNIINELDVNLAPDKNYLYVGTKYNYTKDGLGLELYSNSKAKYFGRFINDQRVSLGRFIINNKNYSYYYYGEIKGLYACGFGWHENYKESTYYEGMWNNSKKEGYGIEKYNKDNSVYQGCFSNGKKDGIGYYVWSDNSSYMGEWSRGTLEGYGIYHFQDGSIYTGLWKNNKMNGLGEFTFPELKTYFGFFERDKRSGFGVLIWYKENKVFIGFWADNKQNGLGKFINNNKRIYGLWENGTIKEKIKDEESFFNRLNYEEKKYQYLFKFNSYNDILMKINHILRI